MTVDLSLFQVTAATNAAEPDWPDAVHPRWQALSNALLEVLDAAETVAAQRAKATRIAARLDDPAVQGTTEQRAAAEAAHWSCVQSAKRARDELMRAARAAARHWKEVKPVHRAWVLADFPRGWHDSPAWDLVRLDQTVAPLEPWPQLLRARDAIRAGEVEDAPF